MTEKGAITGLQAKTDKILPSAQPQVAYDMNGTYEF
jgi:hypothetical protein